VAEAVNFAAGSGGRWVWTGENQHGMEGVMEFWSGGVVEEE
jgi:hypothetical protein